MISTRFWRGTLQNLLSFLFDHDDVIERFAQWINMQVLIKIFIFLNSIRIFCGNFSISNIVRVCCWRSSPKYDNCRQTLSIDSKVLLKSEVFGDEAGINARVGVDISHPQLDKHVIVPFSARTAINADRIMSIVERIVQSNGQFGFDSDMVGLTQR